MGTVSTVFFIFRWAIHGKYKWSINSVCGALKNINNVCWINNAIQDNNAKHPTENIVYNKLFDSKLILQHRKCMNSSRISTIINTAQILNNNLNVLHLNVRYEWNILRFAFSLYDISVKYLLLNLCFNSFTCIQFLSVDSTVWLLHFIMLC